MRLLLLILLSPSALGQTQFIWGGRVVDFSPLSNSTPANAPLFWLTGKVIEIHPALCIVKRTNEVRYHYTGPSSPARWDHATLSPPGRQGIGGVIETPRVSQRELRDRQFAAETIYLLSRQQGGMTPDEYYSLVPPTDRHLFSPNTTYSYYAVMNYPTNTAVGRTLSVMGMPVGDIGDQRPYPQGV